MSNVLSNAVAIGISLRPCTSKTLPSKDGLADSRSRFVCRCFFCQRHSCRYIAANGNRESHDRDHQGAIGFSWIAIFCTVHDWAIGAGLAKLLPPRPVALSVVRALQCRFNVGIGFVSVSGGTIVTACRPSVLLANRFLGLRGDLSCQWVASLRIPRLAIK